MDNILLILKKLLNSIDDEQLKDLELWIDNDTKIKMVGLDKNAISIITEKTDLRVNGDEW